MAPGNNWIRRSTQCAQAWREPRWRLQLLPGRKAWVHSRLPGIVPAAIVRAATAHMPPCHGA